MSQDKAMFFGTVKFYNKEKRFGFIKPDNGTEDIYVHENTLKKSNIESLKEGDRVSYDEFYNKRTGKTAANSVQLI